MEPISTSLMASALYDLLKKGVKFSAGSVKEYLGKWVRDDVVASVVADELAKLGINEDMSERLIERRLDESAGIAALIRQIQAGTVISAPSTINNVTQAHSGSGDNVAGNKIAH